MKIGIDARLFGNKHTGVGRYVENLIKEVIKLDHVNEYVVFVRSDQLDEVKKSIGVSKDNSKTFLVVCDSPLYSLSEQVRLPSIINKEKPDLVHFPHFNVPFFYRRPYVVTVHDLIKHFSKGKETTTRGAFFYWLKYLGYKFVFRQAVKRAKKIFVPSQTVKEELLRIYSLPEEKVIVTYEGWDQVNEEEIDRKERERVLLKYGIEKPFVVYTGNVYPHKNIDRLIQSIKLLNSSNPDDRLPKVTLIISCARSVFWERLKKSVDKLQAGDYVKLAGFIPDKELVSIYKEAEALVFPTLAEGFGLPGIEAMSVGLPVVCSDIPVLREIYDEAALYFDPKDPEDMAKKIRSLLSDWKTRKDLISKGLRQVKKYSWQKMAEKTLDTYNNFN